MTYEKFSNHFKAIFAFLAIFVLSCPVHAQQNPTYEPPAMFDEPLEPMVRPESKNGYIVEPLKSQKVPLSPDVAGQPKPDVIAPRVSANPDATILPNYKPYIPVPPAKPKEMAVPVAPKPPKMMEPIIEKPTATIAPVPTKPVMPSAPAIRDPKESAIKGPKTMPALPAGEVSKDEIFTDAPAPQPDDKTIMERHQEQVEEKKASETLVPVAPLPNANIAPSTFETSKQGVLKKSIVLKPGQIGLVPEDLEPIAAGIIKELAGSDKEDWRVQIRASATPYGTGLSSDRRIALNRALSLRSGLIERGLAASRIDVLAEGLQTSDSKPGDRIDIYLFGPALP